MEEGTAHPPRGEKSTLSELEAYKEYVKQRLSALVPIFAKASVGDFSEGLTLPDKADEFMELYVGVEVMLEVIRSQISELQELNKSLQQKLVEIEEAKVRGDALLASIGDSVVAIDRNEKVIYINQVAERLFGRRSDETVGKSFYDFWIAKDENGTSLPIEHQPIHQALLTNQRIEDNSHYYTRLDGSLFPVASTASPIVLRGKIEGVIMAIRDITEEKKIDRAKDELISLASHQLRTPLSIVKWSSAKLIERQASLEAKERQYADDIYAANERMIELVNTLLNASRLELGKLVSRPEAVTIEDLLKSVCAELRPQVEQKKLHIVEGINEVIESIEIDPRLFRIILQNLISNAVKYTPEGGEVKIQLEPSFESAVSAVPERLSLSVSDTGQGIPKEAQEKIFTKMFRADNAREIDPDGTGLGLYIVKSIVEQLGGKVWFTSEEKKGTTFYVILPIKVHQREKIHA